MKSRSTVWIMVWLVLFFPVGLYLLWTNKNWNQKVKLGITGGLIILAGLFLATNHSSPEVTNTPQISHIATVSSTPIPISLTDKIKAKLPDDLKDVKIEIEDAVQIANGQVSETPISGQKAVIVTEKQGDGFWDTKMAREGGWITMTTVAKNAFPVDSSIYSVTLIVEAPVTNAYGKNEYDTLETSTFTRGTYNKIDFANFNSRNVPAIADIYSENNTIK